MKLYKNVDLQDLEKILKKGILSLDDSENNNWQENKRAKNATDVVYLFEPINNENSFTQYGMVLLEIETSNATKVDFSENDHNKESYVEWVSSETIEPKNIVNIYIPNIFKNYIELPQDIVDKITWVDIQANYYYQLKDGDWHKAKASDEILAQFAKTVAENNKMNSTAFNYFTGTTEEGHILDVYEIEYKL